MVYEMDTIVIIILAVLFMPFIFSVLRGMGFFTSFFVFILCLVAPFLGLFGFALWILALWIACDTEKTDN